MKPPEIAVVILEVPVLPLPTVMDVGEALTVKLGAVPVTVRVTVACEVMLPEVPVTVMGYVPVAVLEATVIVIVEVPAPVIEVGLKPTVTPVGCPLADNEIDPPPPSVLCSALGKSVAALDVFQVNDPGFVARPTALFM